MEGKSFLFFFLTFFYLFKRNLSQDDCCPGETYWKCPCQDKSLPRSRCCDQGFVCMAAGGCRDTQDIEKDLEDLRKEVSEDKCSYYEKLDNIFQCGASSYSEQYGKKYCQSYLDKRDVLGTGNWHDNVRKCIQDSISTKLEENYKDKGSITCEALNRIGYEAQLPCYFSKDPSKSYCALTPKQKLLTNWIALNEITKSVPTECAIFESCLDGNITKFCQPLNFEFEAFDWTSDKTSYYSDRIVSSIGSPSLARYYLGSNVISFKRGDKVKQNNLLLATNQQKVQNITTRYLQLDGVEEDVKTLQIGNFTINNAKVIVADKLNEPFNKFGNKSDAIIGLGPESDYIKLLSENKHIKEPIFYHEDNEIVFGKAPIEHSNVVTDFKISENNAWRIKARKFSFGDIVDSVNTTSDLHKKLRYLETNSVLKTHAPSSLEYDIEIQDNLDRYMYFTSKSTLYFNLFQSLFFGKQNSTCFPLSTGMLTYVVQCGKDLKIDELPTLNLHITEFGYRVFPQKLFVNKGRFYEFLIMFQIFDEDKSILATGTSFLNRIGVKMLFKPQVKAVQLYGGSRFSEQKPKPDPAPSPSPDPDPKPDPDDNTAKLLPGIGIILIVVVFIFFGIF